MVHNLGFGLAFGTKMPMEFLTETCKMIGSWGMGRMCFTVALLLHTYGSKECSKVAELVFKCTTKQSQDVLFGHVQSAAASLSFPFFKLINTMCGRIQLNLFPGVKIRKGETYK